MCVCWTYATSVICTNTLFPPDSSCPDGKRWHGIHSGQRQARRRVVRNAGQPTNEERLLHRHVSSGGPEVLIEDLLPKSGAQEGGWGSSAGVLLYHTTVGGLQYTPGLIFTSFWGVGRIGKGGGTQAPSKCLVNKDIAPLAEPSYDCPSSSTLPAEHGPHCLPYCNTTNSHTLFHISVLVGAPENTWRDSGGAQPGHAFFP